MEYAKLSATGIFTIVFYPIPILNLVETALAEEGGDVQKVIARVKAIEYDTVQGPKQIEPAYLLNLEAKVKVIKKRLENRSENIKLAN